MKKIAFTLLFLCVSFITYAQTVSVELFKDGFSNPIDIQNAGDDRLFIVEQGGKIKILNTDATVNTTPFLNISSSISSGGERGLLGLAFHPDYLNNGYFFVNYSNSSGDTQVSRFTVDGSDPNIADPASELQIITIDQPYSNHNGGCVKFGSDGYLYIGMGDGGSAGDPENRAQNLMELLGKMLRIDINNTAGANNYAIPADNPFIADPNALDEIWAYGLRNPWRFSFDEVDNSLWIADVGQNQLEEVNKVSNTLAGANYGWRCYEGSQPYNNNDCPPSSELTFPVAQYNHSVGNSITGGYVYHGTIYSDLVDHYIFADIGGMIATVDSNGANFINHGDLGGFWVSFGLDINKEMYVADISGGIHKIIGGAIFDLIDTSKDAISLTPNPAKDSISIAISNHQLSAVTIYDLKGSVVYFENKLSVSEKRIEISSLESGIYMVKIISSTGNSSVKKLIIK